MPSRSPMAARDPGERHRSSSPLELLFDLTFVVAVASAGSALEHGLGDGHVRAVAIGYPLVFFAIWWAWVNFSWFASAYANDDAAGYRVAVLVQMAGVLLVAIGIPKVLAARDFADVLLGYVVMRLAMVGLWLRAAATHRAGRTTAFRYASGVGAVQLAWIAWFFLVPRPAALWVFLPLAGAEMAVPVLAESAGRTGWHHGHIAERYGLFTIIVLGETLAAATVAIGSALDRGVAATRLLPVGIGALLVAFTMWWIYFDMPLEEMTAAAQRSFSTRIYGAFRWGYGHYVVFASAAATGAGIAIAADRLERHVPLGRTAAGLACSVPAAIYLLAVWLLHLPFKAQSRTRTFAVPAGIAAILLASLTPEPVLGTGLVLALLVAARAVEQARAAEGQSPAN